MSLLRRNRAAADTTALLYNVYIAPDPLTATPSPVVGNDYQIADLVLTITNNQSSSFSGTITLGIPVYSSPPGSGGALTNNPEAIVPVWGENAAGLSADYIGVNNESYAEWSLGGGSIASNTTVTLQLTNIEVITDPGAFTVQVTENSENPLSFSGVVLENGFYFYGLVASVYNEGTTSDVTPVAQVPYNTQIQLNWNCSVVDVSAITVYWSTLDSPGGSATPQTYGSFVTPSGITSDTVFTVVATIPVGSGIEPVQYAMSTTVAVTNGDIAATTVTTNALTMTGPVALMQGMQQLNAPDYYTSGTYSPGNFVTYTTTADGFLFAYIGGGSPTNAWGALQITGTTPQGFSFTGLVSGANTGSTVFNESLSSLFMPVPAGSSFTMNFWGGASQAPNLTIYFVLLGNGTITLQ